MKDGTIVSYSAPKGCVQHFASNYHTVLPTEADLERERRVIERKQTGGDT